VDTQPESHIEQDIRAIGLCIDTGLLDAASRGLNIVGELVAFLPAGHYLHAKYTQLEQRYSQAAHLAAAAVEVRGEP
jgi:hypothetical protein